MPARTITRILRRNGVPRLHDCDPLTGELIRASKTTAIRYGTTARRARPHGRQETRAHPTRRRLESPRPTMGSTNQTKKTKIGFDYIH